MAFPKFQTKEVLNKVLNAGEDALKIDIDNVTLDGSQLSVDIDNANDSIVIFSNTVADGSGTNTVPSTVIEFPPSSIWTAPSVARDIGPVSPLVIVFEPNKPPTSICLDVSFVQLASST